MQRTAFFQQLRARSSGALPLLLLALAACTDGPTPLPTPVASVTVSPDTATVLVAEARQLDVTLRSSRNEILTGRAIGWTSSDTAVAKVSASGRVLGIAAGQARITATSEGKSDSARITVQAPNPVPGLASLSPASVTVGSPGFTLTVAGTGFVPGATVRLNGTARPTTLTSATELRAEIPATDLASVGALQVTVLNPAPGGGESAALTFTIDPVLEPSPVPVLGDIIPNMIVAGSSARSLSIGGSGFVPASKVLLDGVERPTTYYNPGLLHVAITAADLASPRIWQISVSNPAPGGGTSEARPFEVTATAPNPQPVLEGISPSWVLAGGPGFALTVRGRNFVPASVVRWRGLDRPTTFVSSTELRAQIPAADIAQAGSASVSVFNPAPAGGVSGVIGLPTYGFSDQGRYDLLFEGTTVDGRAALYVATPALNTPYPAGLIEGTDPTPSPDGSKIAFVGVTAGGDRDIYVVNRDGSGRRRLTDSPELDDQPAWSPDGTKIAFRSYRAERLGDIWVMNADGSNPVNLTPAQGTAVVSAQQPAWSPDGSRIVYAAGFNADRHIWSMRASDGGDKRQLTSTTGYDTEPAWSPNGELIAFTRTGSDGSERILFMRPDGQMVHFPLGSVITGRSPAWSPNGEWIAHAVRAGGQGSRYEVAVTLIHSPVSLPITGQHPGGPGGRNPAWILRR